MDSTQSYDEARRTLTVTTAHLNDWSFVAGAQINPFTATVKVGQPVNLELQICDEAIEFPTPTGTKDQVYRCGTNTVLDHIARKWSVNGVAVDNVSLGTITETSPGRVVYTAPAKKPDRNPVALSVEFRGLEGKDVTFVANVTVVDDAGSGEALSRTPRQARDPGSPTAASKVLVQNRSSIAEPTRLSASRRSVGRAPRALVFSLRETSALKITT